MIEVGFDFSKLPAKAKAADFHVAVATHQPIELRYSATANQFVPEEIGFHPEAVLSDLFRRDGRFVHQASSTLPDRNLMQRSCTFTSSSAAILSIRPLPFALRIECVSEHRMLTSGPCHLNHCSLQTVVTIVACAHMPPAPEAGWIFRSPTVHSQIISSMYCDITDAVPLIEVNSRLIRHAIYASRCLPFQCILLSSPRSLRRWQAL